jgi:hypothetical protein
LIVVLLVLSFLSYKSQTVFSGFELYLQNVNIIKTVNPNPLNNLFFGITDTVKVTAVFSLSDTVNIQKIHIKAGDTLSSTNLISKEFVFDTFGILPDGTEYKRIGNQIRLILGSNFIGINSVFSEIKLEYQNGTFSSPTYFNTNDL